MEAYRVKTQRLYDRDYAVWIEKTLQQLRDRDYDSVDWENLLDELEDMGRRERQSLKSNLVVILLHLLKWQFQAAARTGSWAGSIVEHRRRVREALETSPSLKSYFENAIAPCYKSARKQAYLETGLSPNLFPECCPYNGDEILDDDFLPA